MQALGKTPGVERKSAAAHTAPRHPLSYLFLTCFILFISFPHSSNLQLPPPLPQPLQLTGQVVLEPATFIPNACNCAVVFPSCFISRSFEGEAFLSTMNGTCSKTVSGFLWPTITEGRAQRYL